MREIKFKYYFENRNYGGFYKQLISLEDIENGLLEDENDFLEYEIKHKMQYTGLKDVNGVEIYEGDILRDDIEDEYAAVEFIDGAFVVGWESGSYQTECLLFDDCKHCYVIGNIYQNPELIQDKKDEH